MTEPDKNQPNRLIGLAAKAFILAAVAAVILLGPIAFAADTAPQPIKIAVKEFPPPCFQGFQGLLH